MEFFVKIKKKTDEMKKNTNKNQILHSRSLMGVNSEIEKNQTTRMFDAERIIMPNIEWRVNVFFFYCYPYPILMIFLGLDSELFSSHFHSNNNME